MPDYKVTVTTNLIHMHPRTDNPTVTERLVRAKNVAKATAHVVKDTVQVEKASADELIRLTKLGVEIEIAE